MPGAGHARQRDQVDQRQRHEQPIPVRKQVADQQGERQRQDEQRQGPGRRGQHGAAPLAYGVSRRRDEMAGSEFGRQEGVLP